MNLGTFSCNTTVQYAQQEANRQVLAILQALQANPIAGLSGAAQSVVAQNLSISSEMALEGPQIDADTFNVGQPTPEVETQSESNLEALVTVSDEEPTSEPAEKPQRGRKA